MLKGINRKQYKWTSGWGHAVSPRWSAPTGSRPRRRCPSASSEGRSDTFEGFIESYLIIHTVDNSPCWAPGERAPHTSWAWLRRRGGEQSEPQESNRLRQILNVSTIIKSLIYWCFFLPTYNQRKKALKFFVLLSITLEKTNLNLYMCIEYSFCFLSVICLSRQCVTLYHLFFYYRFYI